jgi:hypothetical protein
MAVWLGHPGVIPPETEVAMPWGMLSKDGEMGWRRTFASALAAMRRGGVASRGQGAARVGRSRVRMAQRLQNSGHPPQGGH